MADLDYHAHEAEAAASWLSNIPAWKKGVFVTVLCLAGYSSVFYADYFHESPTALWLLVLTLVLAPSIFVGFKVCFCLEKLPHHHAENVRQGDNSEVCDTCFGQEEKVNATWSGVDFERGRQERNPEGSQDQAMPRMSTFECQPQGRMKWVWIGVLVFAASFPLVWAAKATGPFISKDVPHLHQLYNDCNMTLAASGEVELGACETLQNKTAKERKQAFKYFKHLAYFIAHTHVLLAIAALLVHTTMGVCMIHCGFSDFLTQLKMNWVVRLGELCCVVVVLVLAGTLVIDEGKPSRGKGYGWRVVIAFLSTPAHVLTTLMMKSDIEPLYPPVKKVLESAKKHADRSRLVQELNQHKKAISTTLGRWNWFLYLHLGIEGLALLSRLSVALLLAHSANQGDEPALTKEKQEKLNDAIATLPVADAFWLIQLYAVVPFNNKIIALQKNIYNDDQIHEFLDKMTIKMGSYTFTTKYWAGAIMSTLLPLFLKR